MHKKSAGNIGHGGRGLTLFGLLIVLIVGIVAGLRLDDWYSERAAVETERMYLVQLQPDIRATLEDNSAQNE